jgi:hypothetical protein
MDNQEVKKDDDFKDIHAELVKKGDKVAVHFTYWFAWFWGIISAIYFFAVTFISVPPAGENFANIILGFLLGTAVSTIINFFFGSSEK